MKISIATLGLILCIGCSRQTGFQSVDAAPAKIVSIRFGSADCPHKKKKIVFTDCCKTTYCDSCRRVIEMETLTGLDSSKYYLQS